LPPFAANADENSNFKLSNPAEPNIIKAAKNETDAVFAILSMKLFFFLTIHNIPLFKDLLFKLGY
jgi:hypothetical protein